MSRTKRRVANHVRSELGIARVRAVLPRHWVVREISPDYGLDLHIEVFEPDSPGSDHADALGEHFFAQVKTTANLEPATVAVRERRNVAIGPLEYDGLSEPQDLAVLRFPLETTELRTIEEMGSAVPVLLLLVEEQTGDVFYVCLNDYITKILDPENPGWRDQESSTIRIPRFNRLDSTDEAFAYIRLLARRAKLISAFSRFHYQNHEYQIGRERIEIAEECRTLAEVADSDIGRMLAQFLRGNLGLGIWEMTGSGFWRPLSDVRELMAECLAMLDDPQDRDDELRYDMSDTLHNFLFRSRAAFSRAENLGRMYEEIVREWRLPTAMAASIVRLEEGPLPR